MSAYIRLAFILCATFCTACADLYDIFKPCCHEGAQYSGLSGRCDNYPAPVANVSDNDQAACLAIIEVCCMKQTHYQTCEDGKQTALDKQVCAIRDTDPGAEQFRECCNCCQLGLVARTATPACQSPGLGEPCDSKYRECCRGEASGNLSFSASHLLRDMNAAPDQHLRDNQSTIDSSNGQPVNDVSNNLPGDTTSFDSDVDECKLFSGQVCSHICVNTKRGFYCTCPEAMVLDKNDNRTCVADKTSVPAKNTSTQAVPDVTSCDLNNPCEQRCLTNDDGNVECRCYDGYILADDTISCEDIDECADGSQRCPQSQVCVNTRGSFTCFSRCPPHLTQNPLTGLCEDGTHACEPGYRPVGGGCEDINECAIGIDSCAAGERCENTVGSFVCRRERNCGTGYTLDDTTQRCLDIDECALGTHNCDEGFTCLNIQGSFRCVPRTCPEGNRFDAATGDCIPVQCPTGLKPNVALNCVDIDECAELGNSACKRHQRCINTRGSYYCRNYVNCPPGYEPTLSTGCQDIDECELGTHQCTVEQLCINKPGTYLCQCPRGLRQDETGKCVDVDECDYGSSICPSNSRCVNTIGSFKCQCVEGLQLDGHDACSDVDECQTEGICQQSCINVLGSYFCSCSRGYQLRDDKRSCQDIDECTQFGGRGGRTGVCGGQCVNLPGSFKCECSNGWRLKSDARTCEDINECVDRTAYCPHADSICFNTRGGYKCPIVKCPDGFIKTNSTGQQNRGSNSDVTSVKCGRRKCKPDDGQCLKNKTKTISWEFLSLPSVDFITAPLSLLNIRAVGYTKYPKLKAQIMSGNEEQHFDTVLSGDTVKLRLVRPLTGPADREVVLQVDHTELKEIITSHVTYIWIFVGN
ncbi:fibulin-1-like [Physella acuta]|uniref:fibulin-1-like n=1 Tax=Physella acuta TaxID=109671 RepID=UPI0027DBFC10|nr:fibulin-1-like [Physella acuta]